MAEDGFGNYTPGLTDTTGFVNPVSGTAIGSGNGAPTVTTPISQAYIDDLTGNFYVNTDGTTGGWVLVGTAGGGAQNNNVIYVADPNTEALVPPDPTKAAFAYSLTPGLNLYNWKTTVPRLWF